MLTKMQKFISGISSLPKQWVWLLVLMLSVLFTKVQASDWVLDASKYNAWHSTDHICMEVFLADLDHTNTFSDGGYVYAKNSSKTIKLMYLRYINQGDDESQTAEVKAYVVENNARAWFTNSLIGEQKVGTSESSFWLTKWGSDNHYMTAKIDYYYPAEMANSTWTIYYEFKHSNGKDYTITLASSVQTSQKLGLSEFNDEQYKYDRVAPDKIQFTTPKLPDDIPSKLSDVRMRTCSYDVTYTFYKQDGSKEYLNDSYECSKSQEKTYNTTIPQSVGNPQQIDVKVVANQGVKDPDNYFWTTKRTYIKSNAILVVPVPGSISMEYRQFDKAATLLWFHSKSSYNMLCTPYIYRIETDENGNTLSGKSWSKRGTVSPPEYNMSLSYNDEGVQQGGYYRYMVMNVPTDWIDNGINNTSLNSPSENLINQLGHRISDVMDTTPSMSIYNLKQDTTVQDKVRLTWEYSRVPTDASTVTFKVLRKVSEDSGWSEYGNVTGDANPAAGSVLSFVDTDLPDVSTRYQYKVQLSLNNGAYVFESDAIYAGILMGSHAIVFDASKGTHDATVRLTWEVKQAGSGSTSFVVSRRYVNSDDEFMRIYSTSGTLEVYTYEDNTVQPGYYYEYKIDSYSGNVLQNTLYDVGFCQARGVISGRVTFGSGSAVEDVRLSLRASDADDENTKNGYSQRVDGASTGIVWDVDSDEMSKVFGQGKSFTVQMFVRPDAGLNENAVIGNIPCVGQLILGQKQGSEYMLYCKQGDSTADLGLSIPSGIFSLLTVENNKGTVSFTLDDKTSSTTLNSNESFDVFAVGGVFGVTEATAFKGNLTEVRVWSKVLTDKEKDNYSDRVLNGRESGLVLYWPMDEGLNRYVFDASYANDMPNGRHATVGNNISVSNIIPVDNQLSRYGKTNENGEYIIRGIPFVGSGTTYTLTPTCGIHEFSPSSRNGFIGNGSMTLNSYDFTDISSFPVRGKVTYLNTNIPVDSVQFMIDGALVQSKEGVYSDANGEFEIAVPIGNHLLECYMNGHKFTSFPLDGSTYDFKRSETVNFVDSTLVNVTGRINGGFSDQNEPVGFNRSVNRLGKATMKLSLGKETQCSFNYIVDSHGDGSFGTADIPVESATDSIKSVAYRAGGSHDDTYYIYITTDENNGEFSAMLPPLRYKVESIKFDGGTDYDNETVFAQDLPTIDASNAVPEKMQKDSLVTEESTKTYEYSAKMIRQYRSNPVIEVKQNGMKNGAFGEYKIGVTNIDNTVDSVQVVTYTNDGYIYEYEHPLYLQDETYDFDINVFESYKNLDTGKEYKEVPTDAVVNIMNDASATTVVYGEKATINGEEVDLGEAYSTVNIQVTPDEEGHVSYQWVGGWPNMADGNLRNLSIGVKIDGRTTMWHAPDSQSDALDLILLGSIGSGTNFVTSGPDAVDMIIRRPPGSTSVASLTSSTITSTSKTRVDTNNGGGAGGGFFLSESPTWEVNVGNVLGVATLQNSKFKIVAQQTETFTGKWWDEDSSTSTDTYSVTNAMTTPSEMLYEADTDSYTAEAGDTYIGRATNLLFSEGRVLGLFKQDDGTFKIDEKDGITVSQKFATSFVYPQTYILNTLIPNWKAIIESKLVEGHIEGDHWVEANTPKVPGKIIYYTKYSPGDDQFGRANGDTDYWSKSELSATRGFPSYRMVNGTDSYDVEDEVEYAINQIKLWEARIYDNEQDKLEAINSSDYLIDNYSVAAGTKISQTTESSAQSGTSHAHTYQFTWNSDMQFGAMFNDAGANVILTGTAFDGYTKKDDTSTTKSNSVSWTMSDGDQRTALSVDVYNSPAGWGPIFRTRGGQTVNPYEGATYTRYYQPGTLLNEATMRVEKPQLKVLGAAELTDIPTGSEAKFTLQLSNQSETNDACTYVLRVKDGSNPNGAILKIDGGVLSNGQGGRSILMNGGETVEKTLIVTQSERSVTDYDDIILVLCSEKDATVLSDEVALRVHFVPSSAHVDLSVDHTVLNQEFIKENGGIIAKMYNLDRQDEGLQGLRLRYRRKGTDTWSLIKQWTTIESMLTLGYEPMPDGSQITEPVTFLDDGLYELQAQTFGKYGNDDVTYESNIIEITQDTHGPKILGMVSPEDGMLTYTNRNNMHVRFNEVLNGNALSKSDNFRIEGGMNNVVNGDGAYPDVAVQLNGNRIETDALYDMSAANYAIDMWFYRQGDGNIISFGTDDNKMSLSTHDNGMLCTRFGDEGEGFETGTQLPADKWIYMAMNFRGKSADDEENRITMLYVTADDKEPIFVAKNHTARAFNSNGKLGIGGAGMQGMMAGLTVWNSDVTAEELYETRTQTRASYTPGLIGYWPMNEGHGTQVTDVVRSRNMHMESESWYINNENRAAHLSGKEALKVDISTFNPSKTDNFAFEIWFRGNEADNTGTATLLSVKNGTVMTTENEVSEITETGTSFCFDEGNLKLRMTETTISDNVPTPSVKSEVVLSNKNYCDGNWHHLAFNVRRGTSAVVYIDGLATKVLPETSVPGISSHYLVVGGDLINEQESNLFTGDVDEIRIWGAALDGQLISDRMYERMDNSYPGLVGYFPMDDIHRTEQGNVVTDFSTANFGESDSRLAIVGELTQSVNAPALKPGSTKMRLEDTQFNFTASEDEIYFSFPDSSLPLMDNNDFVATVSYIKDEHGNSSEPVEWMFHTDFASVKWQGATFQTTEVEKAWNETISWDETISNVTGTSQYYEISGMPTWMTIDKPVGTVNSDAETITFTIGPNVPIGRHTEYIYLTDRLGIRRLLQVMVTVKGDEPDWSVDPNLYESNMTLTGQVYIGDKISENTDTKIAAFDDMGLCRGVGSPAYVSTRDAYYVDMIVYGASATELSSGQRKLAFKMYDASSGNIYPIVYVTLPNKEQQDSILYVPDANYGSYNEPVEFRPAPVIQQPVSLARGWSWVSIYVNPMSSLISNVLPKDETILKRFKNIKSKTAFASVNSSGKIVGELETIEPGQMYKMQLSSKTDFAVYGAVIDVANTAQTIRPGYNWIGTLANTVMSPDEAFAELSPVPGDRVKNRTGFAEFGQSGVWEGTLKSIVPGDGYIYRSMATEAKTFHYPSGKATYAKERGQNLETEQAVGNLAPSLSRSFAPTHYQSTDPYLYPDNMSIIAVVKKDGVERDDAEIGAIINGECRGAIGYNSGYYFLTIMGSSEDDADAKMELRVFIDGEEFMVNDGLPFISDAFIGSLDEPFVLDVDATAIREITTDDATDDTEWYTLQGYKIGRKPVLPGAYIHKGHKVVVK